MSYLAGVVSGGGFEAGVKIGLLTTIVVCLLLSVAIVRCKNAISVGNVLIGLLAGVLAVFGGGLLGLMPVSVLTMKANASKTQ